MRPLGQTALYFGSFWAAMALLYADIGQFVVGLTIGLLGYFAQRQPKTNRN